jgi:chitinase
MHSTFFYTVALFIAGLASAAPSPQANGMPPTTAAEPSPAVQTGGLMQVNLGYYSADMADFMPPGWVPSQLLSHIAYAFGTIGSDFTVNITADESLMSQVVAAAVASEVNPILSVGGWGYGSGMFSPMVGSEANRQSFISSYLTIAAKYGFTGLDIAWEYPGRASAAGVPYSADDAANLLTLLQELHTALSGTKMTVSVAVSSVTPWQGNMSSFLPYVDWFGLMEWDFAVTGGSPSTTLPNAPLYGSLSAYSGVQAWKAAGVPTSQMVFGFPSYGRSFTLSDVFPLVAVLMQFNSPLTNGLFNPCSATLPQGDSDQGVNSHAGVWKWRNLLSQGVLAIGWTDGVYVGGPGWQTGWDANSQSSFVWNNATGEFITYDDPVTVSIKRAYAVSEGMKGMMMWELAYDTIDGELLSWTF